jgi:hypothetical protein
VSAWAQAEVVAPGHSRPTTPPPEEASGKKQTASQYDFMPRGACPAPSEKFAGRPPLSW